MITAKNCAAFVLIALASWRVMACSSSTGPTNGGGAGAGGSTFMLGVGTGASAGTGTGTLQSTGSTGAILTSGNGGSSFLNLGSSGSAGSNVMTRDMDSSCHPIKETPEKVTVTDSSVVTDTIVTLTPVAIFIMQDRSSSTVTGTPPPASPMSWQNSTSAVTAFAQDPQSAGLDIGLGVFPPMSNGQGDCNTGSDCGTPLVPIAALPGNAPKIAAAYQQAMPTAFPPLLTPTECALRGMINTCLQFMSSSPTGEKCVAVLVTDGTPTTCDIQETDLEQIITDGHSKGVDTYTLGLPGSDLTTLDAYAMAGGTDKSIDVSGGPQAFIQALNSIRGKVSHQESHTVTSTKVIETPLRCQWKIPPQQMGEPALDPKKVNVLFTPPGAQSQTFGHVTCSGQCTAMAPPATCPANTAAGGAWYYDNETMPTQVFLCPSTCDAIKNVMDATVDLQFHCPQKILPVQ